MPSFDFFTDSEIQSSIVGEQEIEFYPINPIIYGEPIQFDIPETLTQLTDPNFLLKVKAKIVEKDGADLKADVRVGPVNLLLQSLFKDIVLKANGTIINQASGTYPYKAYIENVYTYSSAAKNAAAGSPQMYYKDRAGEFHAVLAKLNPAFDFRLARFTKSATVEMAGRMHCDLLMQNKPIIPGVKFSVTLFPSSSKFHLMSGTDLGEKLILTSVILKIRRINLTSSAVLSIERSLQTKPAQYPVMHSVVRTTQLMTQQTQISNFVVHNGQVPRLIIVAMTETAAVDGSYIRSPYCFTLNKCSFAQIDVNGKQYPTVPYDPASSMIEPYLNSLRVCHKLYTDSDTGVTFDDFLKDGYEILPFDLGEDNTSRRNGVVTFSAQWSNVALISNQTLFFYILWDNVINIDGRKNVILDYIP